MQRIGSSSISFVSTTTMLLGVGGAGAMRAYSPKVSTLDRKLDEIVADRKAIYARKRIVKGKTIFPGQVLEQPKEPTPLLQKMAMEREHEEDAMRSRQAISGHSSFDAVPSASLEVEEWVATILEAHRRPSPAQKAQPGPPKSAPSSKLLLLSSLKCVLTPPGAHDSEGYGSKDILWSWVVVLAHQEECIHFLNSSFSEGEVAPTERLVAALEAALTSPHSLVMSKLATSSSKVIPVSVAVPLAYMLSFASPSTQSAIGCTLFESRNALYEKCKERIVEAARPSSEELPRHPLALIAISSCFTSKAVKQASKDTIAAFVLTQLRSLCTVEDPQEKIALLLSSKTLPQYAMQINTALVSLGTPSSRSLPLVAALCNSTFLAPSVDPLLELASLLLVCPETCEKGHKLANRCLSTRVKPTSQSLLRILVAMESVPRTAESDALVLVTLRKLLGVRDAPFSVEECKTVYGASWRVGEIPRNLLTVIERDWSKDPDSATSIKRLQMLAV